MGQKNEALTKVIACGKSSVAQTVLRMRNEGDARIPVSDEFAAYDHAEGKIGLHSESSGACARRSLARWADETETWREGYARFRVASDLISIIEQYVPDARCGSWKRSEMQNCQGIAELVTRVAWSRPFLRKGVDPILAIDEACEAGNVLHDSSLLIVGLFDQETIVLDAGWSGLGGYLLAETPSREQADGKKMANQPDNHDVN